MQNLEQASQLFQPQPKYLHGSPVYVPPRFSPLNQCNNNKQEFILFSNNIPITMNHHEDELEDEDSQNQTMLKKTGKEKKKFLVES